MSKFFTALRFTLKWEGGYVNDPDDPGGETKWGISKRAHPDADIKNLTEAEAAVIYAKNYWDPLNCESYEMPEAVAIFDTGVNCGVNRAKSWLKEAKDYKDILEKRRIHYYKLIDDNPKFRKYLNGWLNRLNDLHKYCDILAEERLPK